MTEQTIRAMAKEFAGAYYERSERTKEFRDGRMKTKCFKAMRVMVGNVVVLKEVEFMVPFRVAFPDAKAYVASAWPHWVDYAREKLSEMLAMSDERVSPRRKEQIFDALLEDRERQLKQGAMTLRQLKVDTYGSQGIAEKLRAAGRI